MPGLRRVTLNLNTEVGDKGAKELSDILRDDVCLKGNQYLWSPFFLVSVTPVKQHRMAMKIYEWIEKRPYFHNMERKKFWKKNVVSTLDPRLQIQLQN